MAENSATITEPVPLSITVRRDLYINHGTPEPESPFVHNIHNYEASNGTLLLLS